MAARAKISFEGMRSDPKTRVGTHPHPNPHPRATAKPLFFPSNALKLFGGVIVCLRQKKRAIGKSSEKSKSAQNLHICKKSSNFAAETKTQESMKKNEIKFDERNYRKHSDRNKALIKKSLEELGAGRSVLLDNENSLIAGNGVYEQAKALGIPVRVVETDGSELIAVKRTDVATKDEKRRKLALADNSASDSSQFDNGLLTEDWTIEELKNWGVAIPETIDYEAITTHDVLDHIIYKPSKEAAQISEFLNDELYDKVKAEVDKMEIPKELREFVQIRLANFHRIRFDKVADYYARADEKTKKLFRQLALVFDITGTTFEKDIETAYNVGLTADAYDE